MLRGRELEPSTFFSVKMRHVSAFQFFTMLYFHVPSPSQRALSHYIRCSQFPLHTIRQTRSNLRRIVNMQMEMHVRPQIANTDAHVSQLRTPFLSKRVLRATVHPSLVVPPLFDAQKPRTSKSRSGKPTRQRMYPRNSASSQVLPRGSILQNQEPCFRNIERASGR